MYPCYCTGAIELRLKVSTIVLLCVDVEAVTVNAVTIGGAVTITDATPVISVRTLSVKILIFELVKAIILTYSPSNTTGTKTAGLPSKLVTFTYILFSDCRFTVTSMLSPACFVIAAIVFVNTRFVPDVVEGRVNVAGRVPETVETTNRPTLPEPWAMSIDSIVFIQFISEKNCIWSDVSVTVSAASADELLPALSTITTDTGLQLFVIRSFVEYSLAYWPDADAAELAPSLAQPCIPSSNRRTTKYLM